MWKPLAILYVVISSGILLVKFPFWVLKYSLFPSLRAKASWTLPQQLLVLFLRNFIRITVTSGGTASRDIDAPLVDSNTLVHSHAVQLEPIERSKLKGIVEKTAADVGGLDIVLKNGTNRVGPRKIPAYWFTKKSSKTASLEPLKNTEDEVVVLYLHGGAYLFGTAHEQDGTSKIARSLLAKSAVTRVLSVDYRLAGLAPFPGALIDALAGYDFLVNKCKVPAERIIICGDSAGANLTLALTRYLRDEKTHPMPKALLLLSPWADMTESHWTEGSSAQTNADSDYVDSELGRRAVKQFLKGHASTLMYSPYISPGARSNADPASFSGFPKAFINAGGAEALLDEIRYLAALMGQSIGEQNVVMDVSKDAPHDVLCWEKWGPAREQTLEKIVEWIGQTFPAAEKARLGRTQNGTSNGRSKKDL